MSVIAITNINHGKTDGEVKKFAIGDTVSGLNENQTRDLVLAGAAVETGSNRKYTDPSANPIVLTADEELTQKRDKLIEESRMRVEEELQEDSKSGTQKETTKASVGAGVKLTPNTEG